MSTHKTLSGGEDESGASKSATSNIGPKDGLRASSPSQTIAEIALRWSAQVFPTKTHGYTTRYSVEYAITRACEEAIIRATAQLMLIIGQLERRLIAEREKRKVLERENDGRDQDEADVALCSAKEIAAQIAANKSLRQQLEQAEKRYHELLFDLRYIREAEKFPADTHCSNEAKTK